MVRHLILIAVLTCGTARASGSECLSPDDARRAVTAQKLISIEQASRLARAKAGGDMISAKLCRVDNHLMYDIAILSSGGRVARIGVDAATSTVKTLR